ncbi:hypothetical protein [Nostoc sp. DSM 114160]
MTTGSPSKKNRELFGSGTEVGEMGVTVILSSPIGLEQHGAAGLVREIVRLSIK